MAILIANLGTSDLSIKPEGFNFFLPIGFYREEQNLENNEKKLAKTGYDISLTEKQEDFWQHRSDYVSQSICEELQIRYVSSTTRQSPYDFRHLTETLWAQYQDEPHIVRTKTETDEDKPALWSERLCPGRIRGIIDNVQQKFGVKAIYLWVSDQITPHNQDTAYLFKVIEKWVKQNYPDIEVFPLVIPGDINLSTGQDALFDVYYEQLINLMQLPKVAEQPMLVSIKGGTPAMQSALKIQSLALDHPKLLFIDPQLTRKDLLEGNPSTCQFTAYWRSSQIQKYRTVNMMLEIWDFRAAAKVLKEWNKTLTFLYQQLSTTQNSLQINQGLLSDVTKIRY